VVQRVAEFLDGRKRDRPLFLYVNFHDTHYPYHHAGIEPLLGTPVLDEADISPAHQAALLQMYLNTAANVDKAIGETLAAVEHRLGHRPAAIVTADHGESLFEEGFLGHGYALNEIQTRIPLIVRGLPIVIAQPFGQSDLRDAIGSALASADQNAPPRLVDRPDQPVFQYLGTIDRPRQIALRTREGSLVYDFRTGIAAPAQAERITTLVRWWERMIVARSSNER
jgi:arylsulfatase A-like enzyme